MVGQGDLDVGFGDGKITNIAGYRHFKQGARFDGDAGPADVSEAFTYVDQEQYSNELRYAGAFFDRVNVTTGVYYFAQQINYQDNRRGVAGSLFVYSGGIQDSDAYAWLSAVDFKVSDTFTVNTGLRYSYEKKKVRVATQPINTLTDAAARGRAVDVIPTGSCDIMARRCNFDFVDQNSWRGWTPKVGFEWRPIDGTLIYGFWTRGFRGGGYNVRSGSLTIPPGPFEDEVQSSFEIGDKSQFLDRRLRFNNAVFYNKIKDLQRSIILPDPQFNTVTLVRNTADATVWGVESDIQFLVTPNLVVFASLGYTNGEYKKIKFDLTGDRLINQRDLDLKLPRLSPWTGSVGFGADVTTIEADLTTVEGNEKAVGETVRAFGKLDIFVPNAGIFDGFAEFADLTTAQLVEGYELLFGVNVKAVLLGAKAALPELLKTRGCIVMTLSGSSIYPDGGGVLYVASKHAAHGVMRQLAHELAPAIRVNGVAPGVTRTSLHTPAVFGVKPLAASEVELDKWIEDLTPLALHSNPDDHAGAYVLLASRRDGKMITGAVIKTDGGFDIRGLRRTRGGDRLLQAQAPE